VWSEGIPVTPSGIEPASPGGRFPHFKVYISELSFYSYEYIHTSTLRNNALHNLTLITGCLSFRGYRGLLIGYSNSHTK